MFAEVPEEGISLESNPCWAKDKEAIRKKLTKSKNAFFMMKRFLGLLITKGNTKIRTWLE
jgi:hypothetical protein